MRIVRSIGLASATIFLVAATLTSCGRTERAWEQTRRAGTTESYAAFIKAHPRSKLAAEAGDSLVAIAWRNTRQAHTIESYGEFLHSYPSSPHRPEARELLRTTLVAAIAARDSVELMEYFIRQFPDDQQTATIRERLGLARNIERLCELIQSNSEDVEQLMNAAHHFGKQGARARRAVPCLLSMLRMQTTYIWAPGPVAILEDSASSAQGTESRRTMISTGDIENWMRIASPSSVAREALERITSVRDNTDDGAQWRSWYEKNTASGRDTSRSR